MTLFKKIFDRRKELYENVQNEQMIYFLDSITNAMVNSFSDFNETIEYINGSIMSLLGAERVFTYILNEPKTELQLVSAMGMDVKHDKLKKIGINNVFVKKAFEEKLPFDIDIKENSERMIGFYEIGSTKVIMVPLFFRKEPLGILIIDGKMDKTDFNRNDVKKIEYASRPLAIVIQNAKIHEIMRLREAKLRSIYKISLLMNKATELNELLEVILEEGLRLVEGRTGAILFYNEKTDEYDIKFAKGIDMTLVKEIHLKAGEGITGWAAKTAQVQRVDDVAKDPRYIKTNEEVKSEIAAPIIIEDKVVGVLTIDSDELYKFDKKDEELMVILASQAAIAIKNYLLKKKI